jgi:hypothetical protein
MSRPARSTNGWIGAKIADDIGKPCSSSTGAPWPPSSTATEYPFIVTRMRASPSRQGLAVPSR